MIPDADTRHSSSRSAPAPPGTSGGRGRADGRPTGTPPVQPSTGSLGRLAPGTTDVASPPGAAALRRALGAGTAAPFLPLTGVAATQPHPALCGLTSLVTALNGLGVDPRRVWAGPWRWVTEAALECCVSGDAVRARGVGLDALACTARCNGADVTVRQAPSGDELRLSCK